jgi:hypothetical protein
MMMMMMMIKNGNNNEWEEVKSLDTCILQYQIRLLNQSPMIMVMKAFVE